MLFVSSTLLTISTLFMSALASPHVARQNAAPSVLYPSSGSVWVAGVRHNVTWTSGATGTDGAIYVVKAGGVVDPNPLATNVDLSRGRIEVTVPNLPPSTDYSILLTSDNGRSASSGTPFTVAQSANNLPPAADSVSSGVITVTFSGTTVVATAPFTATSIPGVGVIGGAGGSSASGSAASVTSSASSAASSLSESLSSAGESAASSVSSALSSAASSISSAISSATAPGGSGSQSSPAATGSNGAALSTVQFDFTGMKLLAGVVAIAFTAGGMIL